MCSMEYVLKPPKVSCLLVKMPLHKHLIYVLIRVPLLFLEKNINVLSFNCFSCIICKIYWSNANEFHLHTRFLLSDHPRYQELSIFGCASVDMIISAKGEYCTLYFYVVFYNKSTHQRRFI